MLIYSSPFMNEIDVKYTPLPQDFSLKLVILERKAHPFALIMLIILTPPVKIFNGSFILQLDFV